MKKLFTVVCVSLFHSFIFSQGVAINETGVSAEASALLDVRSITKGLLVPRMRTIERTAIPSPAEGLLVYDIDTHSFWYNHFGTWKEMLNDSDVFSLPYDGTGVEPNKLFAIKNTSPGNSTAIYGRIMGGSGIGLSTSNGLWGDNANGNGVAGTSDTHSGVAGFSNTGNGVAATSISGPGVMAISTNGFGISSMSQTNFGLASSSNGINMPGVLGVNTNNTGAGYGVIGSIENPTGGAGVWGKNNAAAGNGGLFTIGNAANADPALKATTTGNGAAGYFSALGLGSSGHFTHTNPANTNPGILITNSSGGVGLSLSQNASNSTHGIWVTHNGTGKSIFSTSALGMAGSFEITNASNANTTLKSSTIGTGMAGLFEIPNTANDHTSLKASTLGTGLAGTFVKNNTSGSVSDIHDPCVLIDNNSKGHALKIVSLHSPSVNSGMDIQYDGQAFGLNVNSTNGGIHAVSTSNAWSIVAENYSGGGAIKGISDNWSLPAILGEHTVAGGVGVKGMGAGTTGIGVKGVNVNDNYAVGAVTGINNATSAGVGIYGESTSPGGIGVLGKSASTNAAVKGENTGGGEGVKGFSSGLNATGVSGIAQSPSGSFGFGILGNNWGDGDGVRGFGGNNGAGVSGFGKNDANGRAALFGITYTSNTSEAVKIENAGLGAALNILSSHNSNAVTMVRVTKGGTGDYIVFEEENGTNEIRFDNTGKGFFNGGTQNSGADIAESFAVEDDIQNYEPGDVLVISVEKDRTVIKSGTAYSTLVAGVYATKPGVLLSEKSIDADLSDEVPMGVVGVIPTKVCLEGGKIGRGDLLVTSSTAGVAMKADPEKVRFGQVIGKALENYDGAEIGLIRVLVNVK